MERGSYCEKNKYILENLNLFDCVLNCIWKAFKPVRRPTDMKNHMLPPILIMLLLINAFFSSHLWSYATLLTVKVYQPYSFKISVYSNGTIDYSLRYVFNMSNNFLDSFNVEDFGFKIYNNSRLYIYIFPRQSSEELQKIIEEVNKTLLSINSIVLKKDSSHWVYGTCDFPSSIQKIINFIEDISEEAAEVLSLSNCSYVAMAFRATSQLEYGTQIVLEFGCYDNLLRFKLGEDLYSLNVSMLYLLGSLTLLPIVPRVTQIAFVSVKDLKIEAIQPSATYGRTIEWNSVDVSTISVRFRAKIGDYPLISGLKEVHGAFFSVGETFNYAIKMMNHGSKTAFDVIIEDYLPKTTSLVSDSVNITYEVLRDTIITYYLWEDVYEHNMKINASNGKIVFHISSVVPNGRIVIYPVSLTSNVPGNVTLPSASISYHDENGNTYYTLLNATHHVEYHESGRRQGPSYEIAIGVVIFIIAVWVYYEVKITKYKRVRRGKKRK